MTRNQDGGDLPSRSIDGVSFALSRPPVFVMNPYYSGLGIARSLRGSGVRVYALCSERDAAGASSRYFDAVYATPNSRDEPDAFCRRLIELRGSQTSHPLIFPTRDFDVLLLHDFAATLSKHYVLPQPVRSPILRMMDKLELASVARGLGMPTPATRACGSSDDIDRCALSFRFPVVVKPRYAYQWRGKGDWEKVGAQKAIVVEDATVLRAVYARLAQVTEEVLVQEYVAGDDSDIVVSCCYVDRTGALNGYFTGRKLKQNPPLIGTGSVVEATDIPAIVAPSYEILKAFDYRGIAEIEYKYDAGTCSYQLIEINARHWDQHELGNLVGVNITRLAYADMIGERFPAVVPTYGSGQYKWIAERELVVSATKIFLDEIARRSDAGRARRTIGAFRKVVSELRRLTRGKKIFALVRMSDPLPGIVMAWTVLCQAFVWLAKQRQSHQQAVDQPVR